jgi:two-component system, NtrC family, response regulator HydG
LSTFFRIRGSGKIRELENAVERACGSFTGTLVELADLPDEVGDHQSLVITSEHVRPLHEIERDYILAALERNYGTAPSPPS